jgi:hypothetical protein
VKRAGKNAWAATVIANQLKAKGGEPVGTPEGFFVLGTEGPLVDGELERAKEWARQVVASADTKTA